MSTKFLAILSADNVLRVVSKNGSGIEERAAVALGKEHSLPQLMELVDTLVELTEKPEAKPKPKAITAKAKEKPAAKPKRFRHSGHDWLKSSTLIRFIDQQPGMTVPEIARHMCISLGREYINASNGDGNVVRSRLGNLVTSKRVRRDKDGTFYSTSHGLEWADKNDPLPPENPSVAEGQELLAE